MTSFILYIEHSGGQAGAVIFRSVKAAEEAIERWFNDVADFSAEDALGLLSTEYGVGIRLFRCDADDPNSGSVEVELFAARKRRRA